MFYSQCLVLLCATVPSVNALRSKLESLGNSVSEISLGESAGEPMVAHLTLDGTIPAGGKCHICLHATPWPDELDAPGTPAAQTVSWHMGGYGSGIRTQALAQCAPGPDPSAQPKVGQHQAFIRILGMSQLLGPPPDHGAAYDAKAEFMWMLRLAAALSALPEVLLYFNPASSVLLTPTFLNHHLQLTDANSKFPILALASVRTSRIDGIWRLADLLGLAQLGLQDIEFAVPDDNISQEDLSTSLYALGLYQVSQERHFGEAHTVDGPGNQLWSAQLRSQSCGLPNREVVHFLPKSLDPRLNIPEVLQRQMDAGPSHASDATTPAQSEAIDQAITRLFANREAITNRARAWVLSPRFREYYEANHPASWYRWLFYVKHPLKGWRMWRKLEKQFGPRSAKLRQAYQTLGQRGELWLTSTVIASSALISDLSKDVPLLGLVAHQQRPQAIKAAAALAEKLADLYAASIDTTNCPQLRQIMADDEYHFFRQRTLPPEETDGLAVSTLDLVARANWIYPSALDILPVLALPELNGAMIVIPWQLVEGQLLPLASPAQPDRPMTAHASRRPTPSTAPTRNNRLPPPSGYRRASAPPTSDYSFMSGCGHWILRTVILGGIGLILHFCFPETFKSSSREMNARTNVRAVNTTPLLPFEVISGAKSKLHTVTFQNYQPLRMEPADSLAFVFTSGPFCVLVTPADQTRTSPLVLWDNQEKLTLKIEKILTLERIWLQQISDAQPNCPALPFSAQERLVSGENCLILLGPGQTLEGTLALPSGQFHALANRSKVLRLDLATETTLAGKSGAPVIQKKSGNVVGMLLSTVKLEPQKSVQFETLCANPQ